MPKSPATNQLPDVDERSTWPINVPLPLSSGAGAPVLNASVLTYGEISNVLPIECNDRAPSHVYVDLNPLKVKNAVLYPSISSSGIGTTVLLSIGLLLTSATEKRFTRARLAPK